jgi:histidyl-tRNA synthetase
LRLQLMPLMRQLRAAGVRCDSDLRGRSLRAMLRQAASLGARTVAIIGPREHAAGVATLRDMTSGDQREVPLNQLAEALL